MKRLYIILSISVVTLTFMSCEKLMLTKDQESTPEVNFNYMWEELNNKYSFFEYKGIDWDSVRTVYDKRIEQDMDDFELFEVLADLLFELRDGHVNLMTDFNVSRNWRWFLDYSQNFNETVIERSYLGDTSWYTGPLHNNVIDSVLYIYYSSFSSLIKSEHIDFVLSRADSLKGIIIDIRNNGGGSLGNAYALASMFTEEDYPFALSRIKNGPGTNDFSPWDTLKVNSRTEGVFLGPVVLLVNRSSYSASNFFAQMMNAHPSVTLMGDKSGGGGGIPISGELPNGWIFRYSGTQTISLDGVNIEGGVEVDNIVMMDADDEANGIDSIIESAIDYILEGV